MENQTQNKFIIPAAIIIAGLIIGGAVFYDRKSSNNNTVINPGSSDQAANVSAPIDSLRPVDNNDHALGPKNADVTMVIFSDLECSFCKRFHTTTKQLFAAYEKSGKLRIVFRHFPLDIHPKSKTEAIASECAAKLGGNEKFWQYIDRIFEITPSNNGLDLSELPKIAEYVGLNKNQFEKCLAGNEFNQVMAKSSEDAIKSGAQGTPYAVIIGPKGQKIAIPGALPFENIKQEIDKLLAE